MSDIQQPISLDEALGSKIVKQASDPSHYAAKKALEAQVTTTFSGEYRILSSRYFDVSADVPWVAVSKNIQNQMLERSIDRAHYENESPGMLLIDFYPQPHGAFVLAMTKNANPQSDKLVGYFTLQPKT